MIGRITGTLESLNGTTALLALPAGGGEGGLAYEVMCPAFLEAALRGQVGRTVTLVTLQYLDSPNQGATFVPRLIGFLSRRDRDFFELFTTVKGIGNRKALRAMAVEPAAIAAAIAAKDAKGLTKLPEIGQRLAETIIAELTGKVEAYLSAGEVKRLDTAAGGQHRLDPVMEETVAALVALGETRGDAQEVVVRTASKRGTKFGSSDELLAAVFATRGR